MHIIIYSTLLHVRITWGLSGLLVHTYSEFLSTLLFDIFVKIQSNAIGLCKLVIHYYTLILLQQASQDMPRFASGDLHCAHWSIKNFYPESLPSQTDVLEMSCSCWLKKCLGEPLSMSLSPIVNYPIVALCDGSSFCSWRAFTSWSSLSLSSSRKLAHGLVWSTSDPSNIL